MSEEKYRAIREEMDNGEFYVDDWCGGNIDDAFNLGLEFAEAEMKYNNYSKID